MERAQRNSLVTLQLRLQSRSHGCIDSLVNLSFVVMEDSHEQGPRILDVPEKTPIHSEGINPIRIIFSTFKTESERGNLGMTIKKNAARTTALRQKAQLMS